jgi:hypothetical protein
MSTKHTCHNPHCEKEIRPELFACPRHWFSLPVNIRTEIKKHYRPGQEGDKKPSENWLGAARAALEYWEKKFQAKKASAAEAHQNEKRFRDIAKGI